MVERRSALYVLAIDVRASINEPRYRSGISVIEMR